MGTRLTMQYKFGVTTSIIKQLAEKEFDILKEELISTLMMELFCERRKAMEMMKAVIIKFPYKEGKVDGKKGYIYNPSNDEINP